MRIHTHSRKRVFNSGDYRSLSDSQRRVFRQVVDDLSTILGGYESEDGGYVYYIGSDWWNMQELPYPVAATEKLDPATARPLVVAAAESLLA